MSIVPGKYDTIRICDRCDAVLRTGDASLYRYCYLILELPWEKIESIFPPQGGVCDGCVTQTDLFATWTRLVPERQDD